MNVFISWIDPHDGSISSAVELPGEAIPNIGDVIVEPLEGEIDACEVVERYVYFDENNEETWHLILNRVELKPGRIETFRLPKNGVPSRSDLAKLRALNTLERMRAKRKR